MTTRRDFLLVCAGGASVALAPKAFARATHAKYPPVPQAYQLIAGQFSVPSRLLFAIALQESVKSTDGMLLPYPWTLNVEEKPERFPTYRQAVERLEHLVSTGVQNIDCGAVQVNWRWHKQRLGTPVQALHPYHNIRAGADYLRECFQSTGDWFKATGRYHSPADPKRAEKYAQQVFSRMSGIHRA